MKDFLLCLLSLALSTLALIVGVLLPIVLIGPATLPFGLALGVVGFAYAPLWLDEILDSRS